MFAPNKEEVRRFFCDTWRKARSGDLLTPMGAIARDWMLQHPEYASELSDLDAALSADYDAAYGKANPFLHLSMHLSISEQISIDQPPGLRDAYLRLAERLGSKHEAHHEIMECLGEMLWTSQRNNLPPDGVTYVECVKRRAHG